MANANAQTHDIDLASPNLNLDKYKLGVSQFDGFNYRNSPFISHEIKNLYTKQTTLIATDAFCIDGDVIVLRGRNIYRNDTLIHSFASAVNYYNLNDIKKYYYDNYNQIFAAPKYIGGYLYYLTYNNTDCYLRRITLQNLRSKIYPTNNITHFTLQNDIINVRSMDWIIPKPFSSARGRYIITYIYDTSTKVYSCAFPNWDNAITTELISDGQYDIVIQDDNYNIFILKKNVNTGLPSVYCGYRLYDDVGVNSFSRTDYNNGYLYVNNVSYVTDGYYSCLKSFIPYKYGFIINPQSLSSEAWQSMPNFNTEKIVTVSGHIIYNSLNGICCEVNRVLCKTSISISSGGFSFGVIQNLMATIKFDYYCPCIPFAYKSSGEQYVLCYATHGVVGSIKNTFIQYIVGRDSGVDGYCGEFVGNSNKQMIRLLYNNCVLTGVSALYDDNIGFSDINRHSASYLFEDNIISNILDIKYNSIIFDTNKNLWFITINNSNSIEKLQIFERRYIIAQTADYLNCYDLKEKKLTHIADDWNSRFIFYANGNDIRTDCFAASVGALFQSDIEYSKTKHTFPGRQGNARFARYLSTELHYKLYNYVIADKYFNVDTYLFGLDLFVSIGGESLTPKYKMTVPANYFGVLYDVDIVYPNLEGNLQEPIPIIADYNGSNIIPQVKMLEQTTLLFPIGTTYFALYYLLMVQEDAQDIFTIQSNIYGVNDDVIYSLNYKDGITSVNKQIAKCNNLRFLCSTPISAFFWSYFNNTIYQFQGDCLLHRGQVIDEINDILYIDYIEATNDIIMCCDTYTIVLSEQYAYKIDGQYSFCDIDNEYYYLKKFTNTGTILRGVTILQIAYKPYLDFKKQNIIVKTQLYGLGDNMLSETDCVFIRVFNAENETGSQTVKVGGFTLTDKKTPLLERTFTITSSDWTDDGSYYIRYQPTFQKALGIQIEIESSVPITYIGVSNIPDTKMITKL